MKMRDLSKIRREALRDKSTWKIHGNGWWAMVQVTPEFQTKVKEFLDEEQMSVNEQDGLTDFSNGPDHFSIDSPTTSSAQRKENS